MPSKIRNPKLTPGVEILGVGNRTQVVPANWSMHVPVMDEKHALAPFIFHQPGRGLEIGGAFIPFMVIFKQKVTLDEGDNYLNLKLFSHLTLTQGDWRTCGVGWFVGFQDEDGRLYKNENRWQVQPLKGPQSFSAKINAPRQMTGHIVITYTAAHGNTNGAMYIQKVTLDSQPRYDVRIETDIPNKRVDDVIDAPDGDVDLWDYIVGDGRAVRLSSGETCYTKTLDNGTFLNVRNANWRHGFWDNEYIYFGLDLMNDVECYMPMREAYYGEEGWQYGAPWVKRRMSVGDVFEYQPYVSHHWRLTGGYAGRSGRPTNFIKFVAYHKEWRGLKHVVELAWYSRDPEDGATPHENYFYAKGYGLVGWNGNQDEQFPTFDASCFRYEQHQVRFLRSIPNDTYRQ